MTDFHLIFFLDNQNLGFDNKIGFLSGTVSKLLDKNIERHILDISAIVLIHAN